MLQSTLETSLEHALYPPTFIEPSYTNDYMERVQYSWPNEGLALLPEVVGEA